MRSAGRGWALSVGLAVVASVSASARCFAADVVVESPSGQVRLEVAADGTLRFNVTFKDRPVIEQSAVVFRLDGVDLADDVEAGEADRYRVDETYPWRGVHATATNRCNGVKLPLRHRESGARYTLEARAFDDAAAFRIVVPGEARQRRVPDEATTFRVPDGSTVWYHDLGGHYEATYKRKAIGEVAAGEWAAPPVTFRLPGGAGYASITEAALRNYSGMALEADGKRGLVVGLGHRQPLNHPFDLRYGKAEHERLSKPAAIEGTIQTPWRVVMVGADLNGLVNCDALHNLCAPPDPRLFPQGLATAWARPGRAVWKYLDGGQNSLEEMKNFTRMAGQLGFEYHVIEGFWQRWSEEELRGLTDYAREQKVGIILWKHTKELRDVTARTAFFDRVQRGGGAGVKLDFFDHEAKEVVDLYEALLREAAQRKLVVNFHGANKPTGLTRTWPNELTREAVRGMESSRLAERAVHNTTLPFTRLLAGHADYTPVHFGQRRGDTSVAHQIASAAVLDSSLLTYGAHPQKLLDHPAVEMIRSIPATWDQTIVLPPSEIGEVAVLARRKGDAWFLAALNGPAARKVEARLSFLPAGEHDALVVRDAAEDDAVVRVENTAVRGGDTMRIELRGGGGWIGRFAPRRAR
jgi:alpha-glucosidase